MVVIVVIILPHSSIPDKPKVSVRGKGFWSSSVQGFSSFAISEGLGVGWGLGFLSSGVLEALRKSLGLERSGVGVK